MTRINLSAPKDTKELIGYLKAILEIKQYILDNAKDENICLNVKEFFNSLDETINKISV
jgi:2-phosphoglycerate kinase